MLQCNTGLRLSTIMMHHRNHHCKSFRMQLRQSNACYCSKLYSHYFPISTTCNHFAVGTLDWVFKSQSEFDLVLYKHHWEFPIHEKIIPMLTWPNWTQNQTVNFINSYQQKIVDLRNIVIKYMEKTLFLQRFKPKTWHCSIFSTQFIFYPIWQSSKRTGWLTNDACPSSSPNYNMHLSGWRTRFITDWFFQV